MKCFSPFPAFLYEIRLAKSQNQLLNNFEAQYVVTEDVLLGDDNTLDPVMASQTKTVIVFLDLVNQDTWQVQGGPESRYHPFFR